MTEVDLRADLLPNPYLDDAEESAAVVSTVFGAASTVAAVWPNYQIASAQFTGMWVANMVSRGVMSQGDETPEETHSRAVRSILWALANAVKVFSTQEAVFAQPVDAVTNQGCECGTDHEAEHKVFQQFFAAGVANEPDSAVAAIIGYMDNGGPEVDPVILARFGQPSRAHKERYFLTQLVLKTAEALVRTEVALHEAEHATDPTLTGPALAEAFDAATDAAAAESDEFAADPNPTSDR